MTAMVQVKDEEIEDSEYALRSSTGSSGLKRRRSVMEAVELPTLACIKLQHEKIKAMKSTIDKLKNPNAKMNKKNSEGLKLESLYARLNDIALEPFHVDLDETIKGQVFTRVLISNLFGGNTQATFPSILKERLDEHGKDDFMFLSRDYNPHAPQITGAPGLFYGVYGKSTPTDLAAQPKYLRRLFTRLDTGAWLYVGQYHQYRAPNLTLDEYMGLADHVKLTWANNVCTTAWGLDLRVRVALRKTLQREPSTAELSTELAAQEKLISKRKKEEKERKQKGKRKAKTKAKTKGKGKAKTNKTNVPLVNDPMVGDVTVDLETVATPTDILRAFFREEESMSVWNLKCIGYDTEFQRTMFEKNLAQENEVEAEAMSDRDGPASVRDDVDEDDNNDDDDDNDNNEDEDGDEDEDEDVEEVAEAVEPEDDESERRPRKKQLVYIPRGTRSRPIRV
ncbi:hypothetical protein PLICRDRAFT_95931 [Plicaturopsis crispa FD-325 SS-3]|uniref:DUF6697 domain-containing protein n=1 Tax=Plicaturopsis crispa FD-325 SS-3 TaxID=944288 RepID=A0A0C9T291_PLICR|nr:hypothetical protein PLICRDRAFT_95931 [Plicaturopsis crispa FD-325 SS-3]